MILFYDTYDSIKCNVILSSQMSPVISFQSKSLLLVYDMPIQAETDTLHRERYIFHAGEVHMMQCDICRLLTRLFLYFGLNISCFVVFSCIKIN